MRFLHVRIKNARVRTSVKRSQEPTGIFGEDRWEHELAMTPRALI